MWAVHLSPSNGAQSRVQWCVISGLPRPRFTTPRGAVGWAPAGRDAVGLVQEIRVESNLREKSICAFTNNENRRREIGPGRSGTPAPSLTATRPMSARRLRGVHTHIPIGLRSSPTHGPSNPTHARPSTAPRSCPSHPYHRSRTHDPHAHGRINTPLPSPHHHHPTTTSWAREREHRARPPGRGSFPPRGQHQCVSRASTPAPAPPRPRPQAPRRPPWRHPTTPRPCPPSWAPSPSWRPCS